MRIPLTGGEPRTIPPKINPTTADTLSFFARAEKKKDAVMQMIKVVIITSMMPEYQVFSEGNIITNVDTYQRQSGAHIGIWNIF
jgi:hypothetical protein